jgi:hypothetical protein
MGKTAVRSSKRSVKAISSNPDFIQGDVAVVQTKSRSLRFRGMSSWLERLTDE